MLPARPVQVQRGGRARLPHPAAGRVVLKNRLEAAGCRQSRCVFIVSPGLLQSTVYSLRSTARFSSRHRLCRAALPLRIVDCGSRISKGVERTSDESGLRRSLDRKTSGLGSSDSFQSAIPWPGGSPPRRAGLPCFADERSVTPAGHPVRPRAQCVETAKPVAKRGVDSGRGFSYMDHPIRKVRHAPLLNRACSHSGSLFEDQSVY